MSDPSRSIGGPVTELLVLWEERRQRGEPASAEELCRDHPELLDEVRRQIEVFAGVPVVPSPLPPTELGAPRELPPTAPAVPGYDIEATLGHGGMGVVYQARHVRLGRRVALKMILAGARARPTDRLRFEIEAEAVASLHHPNIVQIYEVGEADGCPYLALEWVEGGTLAQRLRQRPPSPAEAAALVETLACAVDYAHRRGVIHRDLKPANVLLTADGQPKITDFGLARRRDAGPGQTKSGDVFGTPSYMAPEQAVGRTKDVDVTTDVYALGAILYEALTGQPPFAADSPLATMLLVASQEPTRPSRLRIGVPADLETICLKCLAKEPAKRYASAQALADELVRFRTGVPIRARRVGVLERSSKWARRHPGVVAGLLLAVVTAGLLVAAWVLKVQSDALQVQTAALRQAEQTRYLHHVLLAHAAWRDRDLRQTLRLLDDPVGCPEHQRGWEWRYLKRLCHSDRLTLSGHTGPVRAVAISRDGRLIAGASEDKSVRVWDAQGGRLIRVLDSHRWFALGVAFSPVDRRMASVYGDGTVKVWDTTTWQEVFSRKGHSKPVRAVAFSPDGTRLATAGDDRIVCLWNAVTGAPALPPLLGHTRGVAAVAFSPDGKRLASGGGDATAAELYYWDMGSGRGRALPARKHTRRVTAVAFHPNGRHLASAAEDHTVRVWDLLTGYDTQSLHWHDNRVWGIAFHPDGSRLVSVSEDRTVRVCHPQSGHLLLTLRGHGEDVFAVAYSADGGRLVTGSRDRTIKVWDAAVSCQEARILSGHTRDVNALAFRSDGRALATASDDGDVRVWDPATGRTTLPPLRHPDKVAAVAFSPDRRLLATAGTDRQVRVWDADSGRLLRTLEGHTDKIAVVAFSPTGGRLASAGEDNQVRVWDAADGQPVHVLQGHTARVFGLAWSPDGTRLASAGEDRAVRIWDADRGEPVRVLEAKAAGGARAVAWDPDGRWLAVGHQNATVTLWEVASGRRVRVFEGHTGFLTGVAFSPDGKRLVSGANDRTVKVWDLETGLEALTLRGHGDTVTAVAFSPDGHLLASASDDFTVRLWDATPVKQAGEPGR